MNPNVSWFSQYKIAWFRHDLVAGLILAAYILPAALADSSLANLPPQAGIYACIFSGMVFWIFCSSRHTAITVTSGISLLVGSSLADLAGGDASRLAGLAALTAILTGIIALIAWVVRGGVIVNFISETVLIGFKLGIALVLISTQLPKFFGFSGTHGNFWERSKYFIEHVSETNPTAVMVGLIALAALIIGKLFFKNRPVALIVLVGGIVCSAVFELAQYGVKMLGQVPQGLPSIGLPSMNLSDINAVWPLALACFLLGSVETVAIGRMFAQKHGYRFAPNKEFLALALANVAAGLGRGFPVSGGMSQSLVNESAKAQTPISGLVAAIITLIVAVFFSDLLHGLPQPVLAAIVLIAVSGLVKIEALKHLWHFSRSEFFIAWVVVVGVLSSGILRGVLLGAVISIGLLLTWASKPRAVELGLVPNTDFFADRIRHPENQRVPEVSVFRSEGALLYFNVDYVRDRFYELIKQQELNPRLAIFYLGMVPQVDLAGVEMLNDLCKSLKAKGIEFRLAEAHGNVREALRRGGFEKAYGPIVANQTVNAVIETWRTGAKV